MGWVNSGWKNFPRYSTARLNALRAFIKEVQDAIGPAPIYSLGGDYSVNKQPLVVMLAELRKDEVEEEEGNSLAQGTRLGFTRLRAFPP